MIKTIIVDDEKKFSDALNKMITENFRDKLHVVAKSKSVKEAVHDIKIYDPDLIFLDVEMPPGNGFQVLEQIEKKNFEVIFTTAFDQYAIKAIRFSALDFLLKPFGVQDLNEALKQYDEKILTEKTQKQYEVLLYIKSVSDSQKKIALPTLNGFAIVSLGDIIRCESDSNYTQFHLKDKSKILVCKPLKDYEGLLEENGFFRVHQSHLINVHYIKNYSRDIGGTITMTDGSEIAVSRRKKDEFLKRLMNGF
ncbi:MAG: response regulator transcription factor [Chitinophagales bacterium]|nr:response regulator transcription factor [Chitinophagales bacterium]